VSLQPLPQGEQKGNSIGQAVIAYGGAIEYFIDSAVNYPTLSEAYKVAALNGYNRL